MSWADYLTVSLIIQYVLVGGFYLWQGDWACCVYWVGAFILTLGVLWMGK